MKLIYLEYIVLQRKNSQNKIGMIILVFSILLLFLPMNENSLTESYNSNVGTTDDAYFKVLDLEAGVVYNFTIDVEEYYQMDIGFSIHTDNRPKERNALVTIDEAGQGDETTLYTPEISGDYYIRAFSNYDWGFFTITVKENLTGIEKIVEPYRIPTDWRWLWVSASVIGGIFLLAFIIGFLSNVVGVINWRRIRLQKIDFDGSKIIRRVKARRYERMKRKVLREDQRKEKRELKKKSQLKIPVQVRQRRVVKGGVEIIFVSNKQPRCMVSGLNVDFEEGDVVACPYCSNVAKKPMLVEWLKVKGICPMCRRNIVLEQCPKVEHKEK
ncbi:MAG: hypothetical protein HGN29_17620 [Asgard group archaeon]|nr:hypothetical protein [Asgard group archaeon]